MRQVFLLGGLLAAAGSVFAQPDRLLVPIDARSMVILKGNTNSKAQPRYDQGLMPASQKIAGMRLVAKLTASQQADLDQLLAGQQDPASPNYHNWLTPEQYGERFGLSANDMARISAWLGGQGFSVDYVARARNYLMFSGTAGQVQTTLQTEMHRYQVDGGSHYGNATDPSIPSALEPLILAIQGLDDFRPLPQVAKAVPATDSSGLHYLSPGDIATIYNINPLYQQNYNGAQQSLVVVGQTEIHITDIQAFRAEFGLPANNPQLIVVPGSTEPGVVATDLPEASLDLEYSGAIAPYATVFFVYSSDVWTSAQYAIDQNMAPVMSSSYGGCELGVSSDGSFAASLRQSAQQANAQGITWVSSSGDQGATGCDTGSLKLAQYGLSADWPASIPEITAVGGTEFNETNGITYWSSGNNSNGSSALSYIPEMAWNDTTASIANGGGVASTGGGVSILYAKPTWQTGNGVPNDNARDTPDIAFAAADYHDGYIIYVSGANSYGEGGTSISTPIFAGILTVLNQYLVNNKIEAKAGLGNVNPKLYSLATPGNNIFHDVTVGNNIVPCKIGTPDCTTGQEGYSAGIGYDQATGLGSANVTNLITEWSGLTVGSDTITLSANPSSISANGTTTLTATVKAVSGSTSPAGSVSFIWGLTSLGSATLVGAGGSASASITVYGSVFAGALGAETISAYYGGSGSFTPASTALTLTVSQVSVGSAVAPSVVPDPVYQQTPDAQGYSYFFTIRLTETAGVATTLTGFTFNGQSESQYITSFFGSASVPAHGTLSANLGASLSSSGNVVFGFSGVDASGAQWSQQITVPFLPMQISAAMSLASAPATVAETPNGVEGCGDTGFQFFYQQLDLQELNGFEVELTRFLAGGNDYTQYIPDWFGSWRLAPFGSLLAGICWQPAAIPSTFNYELDGMDTNGNNIVVTATAPFQGPVANAGVLSTSTASVDLTPGASGTAQASFTVNLPAGQHWTATVFPANPRTSWLVVFPLSGTGPGTITVAGASAGLAPGIAQATLVIQSINTLPQFVQVPLTFTVAGSSSVSISAVGNNFSYYQEEAPGMLAVVFGTNLARTTLSAATLPLPTVLGGTSATINGIPAPLYYVSAGQMDIQIPYETPVSPCTFADFSDCALLAVNNNGAVTSYYLEIAETTPGIAQTAAGLVVSGAVNPGKRGGVLDMYITGEGDVTPFLATGSTPVGATPQARLPLSVTIAGIPAQVQFNGIPSWSVGVTQLDVQVPSNAPTGSQQLVVTVGGVASPPVQINVD
jgi:uncharacterized protein (TIGR03437 family)